MHTSQGSCVPPDGLLICFICVIVLINYLVNRLHVITLIFCFAVVSQVQRATLCFICAIVLINF